MTETTTRSFAAEMIADSSGKFVGNELRFHTRAQAEAYARDLASMWPDIREWRVVESTDEPNREDHE